MKKFSKYQTGFSMIELLIGVTLSGMIFLAVTSLITVLLTSNNRAKQLDELEQTKNDLTQELSNIIRWGGPVIIVDGGDKDTLKVGAVGSEKIYQIDNGNGAIMKNSDRLTSDQVTITKFDINDHSVAAGLKSLEISIELENKRSQLIKDAFTIVVSERATTISI